MPCVVTLLCRTLIFEISMATIALRNGHEEIVVCCDRDIIFGSTIYTIDIIGFILSFKYIENFPRSRELSGIRWQSCRIILSQLLFFCLGCLYTYITCEILFLKFLIASRLSFFSMSSRCRCHPLLISS